MAHSRIPGRIISLVMTVCMILSMAAAFTMASAASTPKPAENRKVIFVGDSRTVGMYSAVYKNGKHYDSVCLKKGTELWSAQGGARYSWMKKTGVPDVEDRIGKGTSVVILMGYNDIRNHSATPTQYANYLNAKAKKWVRKGADVYFVSVNPRGRSSEAAKFAAGNASIARWNKKVEDNLDFRVKYIDTYSTIIKNYNTVDNAHFTPATYRNIYRLVIARINKDHPKLFKGSFSLPHIG